MEVVDPKERKRQRERARRAAITEEQRNEIKTNSRKRRAAMTEDQWDEVNWKRREAYYRRKAESILPEVSKCNITYTTKL